jgi:hypothetical protein
LSNIVVNFGINKKPLEAQPGRSSGLKPPLFSHAVGREGKMNKEYSSSVMLMVLGDNLDPDNVSDKLSLVPSQWWRKGQNKFITLKDGTVKKFQDTYEWGGWKRFIEVDHKSDLLEEQLEYWCDILRGKERAISTLKNEGLYCALDIFISSNKTASIIIPVVLQNRIAQLGLELRFSFLANEASE